MSLFSTLTGIPGVRDMIKAAFRTSDKRHLRHMFGLSFPNPVGLAAGFDKDGKYVRALECLGFGFIEVGTVTPKPQAGNPKPRMFRLKKSGGLINRMGFNNGGVEALAERLGKLGDRQIIVGANIGKNKVTPNERATDDYVICFERLHDLVDYFVVNVSSPNTPGLRDLQEKGPLTALLSELQSRNQRKPNPKPILLKIAPDLTDTQLDDIIDIARDTQLAGIVATNTTISREGLAESNEAVQAIGAGGLSGAPVRQRATDVIRYLHQRDQSIPIIGVGGVQDARSAQEKLESGASLVQVYTGFIYGGPAMVKRILKGI